MGRLLKQMCSLVLRVNVITMVPLVHGKCPQTFKVKPTILKVTNKHVSKKYIVKKYILLFFKLYCYQMI